MEINRVLSFVQNGALIWVFAVFLVISYLLFALSNWSFVKPCKYIGICSIIVGVIFLMIKFSNFVVIDLVISNISIPSSLIASFFKPILIMGIVYIFIGIGLIILHNLYYMKKNSA